MSATEFTAPKTIDSMCEAFREHCLDGGGDFIEYLNNWQMHDALAEIADAANGGYTPTEALNRIRKALEELYEIASQAHREKLEFEGIE